MTVTHRGTPTTFTNSWPTTATSTVLTPVSGITNGDLLVAIIWLGKLNTTDASPPAGWTTVSAGGIPGQYTDGAYYVRINVFWKVASGESGNYTFTHDDAVNEGYLCCLVGADTSSPFTPNPTGQSGAGGQIVALGLTTPRDGSLVIFGSGSWDAATATPPTGTTPTFTERYDPTTNGVGYIADGPMTTAGATGDKESVSTSSNNDYWGASLLCIQAAAAASTVIPVFMNQYRQRWG
jgi:hypothetical protein